MHLLQIIRFLPTLSDIINEIPVSRGYKIVLALFFSKRNFDTRFELSFVGIMDISSYKQSEKPRASGKHLTRLAKNSKAAVAYIAILLRGHPSFW